MLDDLTGRAAVVTGQDRYHPFIPSGRVHTDEDIGKMAAFLALEDARNVTGQCVHVDGATLRD